MSEEAIKIFYSYSRKDLDMRNTLEEHLSTLRRAGKISNWHDLELEADTEWGVSYPQQVKHDLQPDPPWFKGGDRPIECVFWWEAVEFCDRLSRKANRTYRLPSEAEWEYACRAGTTTPFHFGEIVTSDLANYKGTETYNSSPKGQYRKETTTVGSFGVANAFGLYDMHGNVWEWCVDHWHADYKGAPTDGSALLTAEQNAKRRLRGGSWCDIPGSCRSTSRNQGAPDGQGDYVGFRVVCVSSWTA